MTVISTKYVLGILLALVSIGIGVGSFFTKGIEQHNSMIQQQKKADISGFKPSNPDLK